MINCVNVRNIKIGEGKPKICVPIIGNTKEKILETATVIKTTAHDLVEWRVDCFKDAMDFNSVVEVLISLRDILDDTPILFTFRTQVEGGEMDITKEAYLQLNLDTIKTGLIDLIDVELFTGDDFVSKIIDSAHSNNVKVVASNHDFERTPSKKELISRLQRMQSLGADILKLAVMPLDKADVLTLLSATEEMVSNYSDRPVVTMSMGHLGAISRISGEYFGSAITFGSVMGASAPGQIPSDQLSNFIEELHGFLSE